MQTVCLRALKETLYSVGEKQGNHGDDIFQAGESLDRHAFEAPFVCSRRWMWDSSEFVSTHVGRGGSSRRGAESINAITWSETQVTTHFAHTANINRTLCACEEQCWHVCAALDCLYLLFSSGFVIVFFFIIIITAPCQRRC